MKEYDEFRDSELENKGLKVLRIKNEELQDLEKVKIKIIKFLDS
jgi:very-short-patch-repair endonuclease